MGGLTLSAGSALVKRDIADCCFSNGTGKTNEAVVSGMKKATMLHA